MEQEQGGDSPANLPHFLEGLSYPASKAQVIEHARRRGATDKFLADLELIDDQDYASIAQLISTFTHAS